jgi:hypothetical protein
MGELSIWHLIVLLIFAVVIAFVISCMRKVLNRAGYSGWWTLTMFIPFVNLIMIWVFAFASWPALPRARGAVAEARN